MFFLRYVKYYPTCKLDRQFNRIQTLKIIRDIFEIYIYIYIYQFILDDNNILEAHTLFRVILNYEKGGNLH